MLAWLTFSVFWNCFDFKVMLVRHSVEKSSPTLAVVDTTWSNFLFFRYRRLLCSISFHLFLNTVQPEVFFVIAKTSLLKKKRNVCMTSPIFTRGNDLLQKRKAWEWRLKFLAFSRMTKTAYGATEGKHCVQGQ